MSSGKPISQISQRPNGPKGQMTKWALSHNSTFWHSGYRTELGHFHPTAHSGYRTELGHFHPTAHSGYRIELGHFHPTALLWLKILLGHFHPTGQYCWQNDRFGMSRFPQKSFSLPRFALGHFHPPTHSDQPGSTTCQYPVPLQLPTSVTDRQTDGQLKL